jgi:AcrR family transcriptional regulator
MLMLPSDRRDQIFAALVECFAQWGVKGTSMQTLAAGMSRPALYQYFSNKREVFAAAASWDLARQAETIEAIAVKGADPAARLEGMLQVVLKLYEPSGDGTAFRAELIDDAFGSAGREWDVFQERVTAAIVGVLRAARPDVLHRDAEIAAAILIASTKGQGVESIHPDSALLALVDLVEFVLKAFKTTTTVADTIA